MTSEANQHSLVTVSGKHSALHRRGQGCVKTAFVLISLTSLPYDFRSLKYCYLPGVLLLLSFVVQTENRFE
jgi:hypothetical protein